jgi:coenzyme F420-reducing hydrogenase gamma subunit
MAKPRIGIFSFTSCEGCSLAILECEDELLDVLAIVDIVNFREGMTEKEDDVDIAFVDGALSTKRDVEHMKHIREHSGLVVAIGACAHTGGVPAMKNNLNLDEAKRYVFGDKADQFDSIPARPLSAEVQVDAALPGCPMDRAEFLRLVLDVAQGKTFRLPNYPVCVECKLQGNPCLFDLGLDCMGVVARAGCNAICPTFGDPCEACRGYVDHPNTQSHQEVLTKAGRTVEEIMHRYTRYNSFKPEHVQ